MSYIYWAVINSLIVFIFFSLFADFTQGMILPKKDKDAKNGEISITSKEFNKMSASKSTPNMQQLQIGVKIDTETYNFNQNFKCPPAELYNVLTLPELMRAFTNAPTQVDSTVGGKFSLFDGQITGEFIELVNDNFEIVCRLFKLNFIFVTDTEQKNSSKVEIQNLASRALFYGFNQFKR